MMNFKKNHIALALTGILTLGVGMNSQAMSNQKIVCNTNGVTVEKPVLVNTISLEDLAYEKDGYLMLPLRLTCEKLGYDVKWDGETRSVKISKDNNTTSITLNKDSYHNMHDENTLDLVKLVTFPLGIAPEITNSSTYVPAKFFEEILKQNLFDIFENNKVEGHISEITTTKNGHMITVEYGSQSIIFIIDSNTEIMNPSTDKKLLVTDLRKGDRLVALHSSQMTRSLPPQTYAYRINVVDENIVEGGVTEINKVKDGHMITVEYGNNQVMMFFVDEETKITDSVTKKIATIEDIKEGDILRINHSDYTTFSLPPQTYALEIEINPLMICE